MSVTAAPKVATARERRAHYRENMLTGFNALAELYYAYWGEFFHLAVFEPGGDPADVAAAYEQTHERYLEAIGGLRPDGSWTWPAAVVRCLRGWPTTRPGRCSASTCQTVSSLTHAAGLPDGGGRTCGSSSMT
jgi:hypothetical protein